MAHLAAGPVPCGNDAMRTQPPDIVMINRLHDAVALPAGILRMADAARGIILNSERSMPLHPGHIMAGGLFRAIHVHMTGEAILSRSVRSLAYGQDIAALQQGNRYQGLIHQAFMAIRALVRQGFGVYENVPGGRILHRRRLHRVLFFELR